MVRDKPFPHIVWDSFLDKKTLSFIEEEFPHEESDLGLGNQTMKIALNICVKIKI